MRRLTDFPTEPMFPSPESAGVNAGEPQWPVLDPAALEGLAGAFVSTVAPHTESDPAAILIQLLAAFGSLIGRSPYFPVEADEHHTNLFVGIVGATSKGRKGTSWGHVQRAGVAVDQAWKERIVSGLTSGEGLIWNVRDQSSKYDAAQEQEVIVDPGVTDKRLMALVPELASVLRVMGREGNTLSAGLREAWDRGDLQTLTKNSPARATAAHITVIGHITSDELVRYLDRTEAANGFANRFLWCCAKRSKYLPEGGNLSESDLSSLSSHIRKSFESAKTAGSMQRSEDARRLWCEVYNRLSDGRPGLLGAVTSRAEAQVTRLSCIYALLDGSRLIERCHLGAALALWRYCEDSARYIFGDALGDPTADRILDALRREPGGLPKTQIFGLFGRHPKAGKIDSALKVLSGHGLAHRITTHTGGRPGERWVATCEQAKEAKKGGGR